MYHYPLLSSLNVGYIRASGYVLVVNSFNHAIPKIWEKFLPD